MNGTKKILDFSFEKLYAAKVRIIIFRDTFYHLWRQTITHVSPFFELFYNYLIVYNLLLVIIS